MPCKDDPDGAYLKAIRRVVLGKRDGRRRLAVRIRGWTDIVAPKPKE